MLRAHDVITLEGGRYRLTAPLAGSSYGLVWRASDSAGAAVALKFIHRQQMDQASAALQGRWIDSATQEIAFLRSLSAWDARHIVRLLDSGWHDGLPVMALELMAGDLAQHMNDAGQGPALGRILDWLGQVNQALAKVHQYGWLYLDLKPANVLLTDLGHVRLADFGTSRLRSAGAAPFYSGTASWQAPEQFYADAQGRYATSERTDWFALGALFYYLVTGAQLQYCHDCAQAYRDRQAGAPAPRATASPVTLTADEASRFCAAIDGRRGQARATGSGAGHSALAEAALLLLRSLLCADPAGRPRHALDISRMLSGIRNRLEPAPPVAACGRKPAWLVA